MNVSKTLKHTNCTIGLLHLDFKFDSTLLPFKFASEDDIVLNLGKITKGNASSELQLDLKKKGSIVFVTSCFTLHVEAIAFTQHETKIIFKKNSCTFCTMHDAQCIKSRHKWSKHKV
jgi:hypothetical protein